MLVNFLFQLSTGDEVGRCHERGMWGSPGLVCSKRVLIDHDVTDDDSIDDMTSGADSSVAHTHRKRSIIKMNIESNTKEKTEIRHDRSPRVSTEPT